MNPAYAEDDTDEEMPLPRESAAPPAEQAQEYDRQLILAVQFLNDALHGNKVNFGGANSKVVQRLYPFYYSSTYKLVLWATVIVHLLLAYLEPLVHDTGDWAHDDGDTWQLSARQALRCRRCASPSTCSTCCSPPTCCAAAWASIARSRAAST